MNHRSQSTPLTRAGPIQWRSGTGWLILSGGGHVEAAGTGASVKIGEEASDIQAAALGWADLDRPLAVLPAAGTSTPRAEAVVNTYTDLGAPSGYVVPVFDAVGAQLAENCDLLRDAGVIHICDGPDTVALVRILRASPAMEAVIQAFEHAAVIVGAGAGAEAFGARIADRETSPGTPPRPEPGWGWLHNVIVTPHFKGAEGAHRLRNLLDQEPNCLGLGIPDRAALGLGPSGEVETLGSGQITVVVSGLEVEV